MPNSGLSIPMAAKPTLRAFLIGEDIDDESYRETFNDAVEKLPC